MKRIYMLMAALAVAATGFAQTDSVKTYTDTMNNHIDTIKVGNYIIIKRNRGDESKAQVTVEKTPYKPSKISTNWFIFDLGFANYNDKSNYQQAQSQGFLRSVGSQPAPDKNDFKLRAVKSSNVNIWVVMQRISLAKGYVNLKYGAGLEMFNFRYESSISYNKSQGYIFNDSINFSKNKIYAGYLSVPFMLNFNTSPGRRRGLSFSAGITAGYLIDSRYKQKSDERGKVKIKGDIGLEKFRLAYVGELGVGPIRLFGSYSIRNLYESGLEQYPYSVGIRFSNF